MMQFKDRPERRSEQTPVPSILLVQKTLKPSSREFALKAGKKLSARKDTFRDKKQQDKMLRNISFL